MGNKLENVIMVSLLVVIFGIFVFGTIFFIKPNFDEYMNKDKVPVVKVSTSIDDDDDYYEDEDEDDSAEEDEDEVANPVAEKLEEVAPIEEVIISDPTYYIQVYSYTTKEPSSKFMNSLKKSSFAYSTKDITRGSTTYHKILIGPYSDKEKSKEILASIRNSLSPKAYLLKISEELEK